MSKASYYHRWKRKMQKLYPGMGLVKAAKEYRKRGKAVIKEQTATVDKASLLAYSDTFFIDIPLKDIKRVFADDVVASDWLLERHAKNGDIPCPRCNGRVYFWRIRDTPGYECELCNGYYNPKSQGVFRRSHHPLWKWFFIIWLVEHDVKFTIQGLSAELEIPKKTMDSITRRVRSEFKPRI